MLVIVICSVGSMIEIGVGECSVLDTLDEPSSPPPTMNAACVLEDSSSLGTVPMIPASRSCAAIETVPSIPFLAGVGVAGVMLTKSGGDWLECSSVCGVATGVRACIDVAGWPAEAT